MHDMPIHDGYEIAADLVESENSIIIVVILLATSKVKTVFTPKKPSFA